MRIVLGSLDRALRVAVIGSGPSGFYATDSLLASNLNIELDIYDRLPVPFGLVRYGVAPDHPKIKNVTKIYEKIAGHPKIAFYGNVTIGRNLSVDELRQYYDVVIFACGAETDKPLGIPNEHIKGSHTATEFVGWYNGHPDFQARQFDLSHPVAVVVGLGNVAMDVARILGKTVDELKNTDISQNALDVLSESKIKEVHVIGRRGIVQAAFTPVEIKEFAELTDAVPIVRREDFDLNPESQKELDDPKVPVRRKNFEIIQKFSELSHAGKKRKIIFHFLKSPHEIKGETQVEELILEKNKLTGPAGHQSAVGTGVTEALKCGLIFRSVGYHGVPIWGIPFDDKKGIFDNIAGRIIRQGQVVLGLYATGWIKRGPSGVIGTNKPDSDETVKNILEDLPHIKPCLSPSRSALNAFLKCKGIRYVTYADWKKIDVAEIQRGASVGKPREKFTSVEKMLAVIS